MEVITPATLIDAITCFSRPDNCLAYMVSKRWPSGIVACPTCGSTKVSFQAKTRRWQCSSHHALRQFSIKTGTILEDSPLPLEKWLPCVWLVSNCKNGVSSWEIHRALGVTQKTAWFMLQRARLALQGKNGGKLSGEIEADESFIGGKARNMHAHKRAEKIHGRGPDGKAIVAAVLERGGEIRAKVVKTRRKADVQALVRENVEAGSNLYTDALKSYDGLSEFTHQVVDHAVEYVSGQVHTNGCENFWSLLKRGLKGTYVSVEPFHLFRYVDEQAFRYNNRQDMNDADRFDLAISQIVGKRLTYKELTGHQNDEPF
jgi:transposase-like protein